MTHYLRALAAKLRGLSVLGSNGTESCLKAQESLVSY
jgi:hypothetical protein